MNKEKRDEYKKNNCYLINNLRDELKNYFQIYEHYILNKNNPYTIILKDEITSKDTNFSIEMKSYGSDYYAYNIKIEWYKSWRNNEHECKVIQWNAYEQIYEIIDNRIGFRLKINKNEIINYIINFVTSIDKKYTYLNRDIKLSRILNI